MFGSLQLGDVQNGLVQEVGIKVHDLSGQVLGPQSFGDSAANFYFQVIEPDLKMKGILHIKGSPEPEYGAWELAGNADASADDRLFYRQGVGSTWSAWKELAFLDSTVAFAERLTTLEAGASNIPVYFSDGKPVASDYDLHTLIRPGEETDIPSETNIVIADRLSVDAGSVSRPVYFSNGVPKPCGDTLNVSIAGTATQAESLTFMATFKVALNSTQASSIFNGAQSVHDIGVSGILQTGNGGTGTNLPPVPGGILYGKTAASYECTAAGATGQLFQSNGNGTPSWISDDVGSIYQGIWLQNGVPTPLSGTVGGVNTPVYIKDGVPTACASIQSDALDVVQATAANKYYITGVQQVGVKQTFYACTPYASATNTTGVYFQGDTGVLYGAAWNDYAEFRRLKNSQSLAGRVVVENGDDTLTISTQRLQPVPYIISDTYGMVIGIDDNESAPVALSGRVLAYPCEDRNKFTVGKAVCSGPNGTVSLMTREEAINYPECIIGFVSAIPDYDTWGPNETPVDGRIWIKIK